VPISAARDRSTLLIHPQECGNTLVSNFSSSCQRNRRLSTPPGTAPKQDKAPNKGFRGRRARRNSCQGQRDRVKRLAFIASDWKLRELGKTRGQRGSLRSSTHLWAGKAPASGDRGVRSHQAVANDVVAVIQNDVCCSTRSVGQRIEVLLVALLVVQEQEAAWVCSCQRGD
jgi:hypothetical protein